MVATVRINRAACILALSAAVLAGCASPTTGTGSRGSTPAHSPSAATRTSVSATPAGLGSALTRIALRKGDLAIGYTLRLIPGGDKVRGEVTLDNCGFNFTTEAHRVARRQYAILDKRSTETGLSNELVAYDTPAQAAKAITQWHTAATTCPHTPVNSTVAGVPDLVEKILQNEHNVTVLPAKNNTITMESATAVSQGTLYNVSILQAHGRFLDIIYLDSTHPITTQELAVAVQLAVTTGHRLVG